MRKEVWTRGGTGKVEHNGREALRIDRRFHVALDRLCQGVRERTIDRDQAREVVYAYSSLWNTANEEIVDHGTCRDDLLSMLKAALSEILGMVNMTESEADKLSRTLARDIRRPRQLSTVPRAEQERALARDTSSDGDEAFAEVDSALVSA